MQNKHRFLIRLQLFMRLGWRVQSALFRNAGFKQDALRNMIQMVLLLSCMLGITVPLSAQFNFNSIGATYTQNFSSFAGTPGTIPANWTNSFNDYVPGGYYSNTGSYSNQLSTYALQDGSSSDYAMGAKIAASGGVQTLTFTGRNNIPNKAITAITVSWDVEQYSTGGRATTVDFTFSIAGASIAGPTLVTAFTGSNANLASVSSTSLTAVIDGISLPVNSTFNFIWTNSTSMDGTIGDNCHIGIDNVVITITMALPIEPIRFTGKSVDSKVALSFATETETDNDFFSIERSTDGMEFQSIGKVNGAGNSTEIRNYDFTDENPAAGLNFYRLKQFDFDGTYTYSKVISVTTGKNGFIRLSPSPATDLLRVHLETALNNDGAWQLLDYTGRLLQTETIPAETSDFQVDVAALRPGAYLLRLVDGQTVVTKPFLK